MPEAHDHCTLKPAFDNELLHQRLSTERNDRDHDELFSARREHDVRITRLETKVALYGAASGVVAGFIFRLIERFLP